MSDGANHNWDASNEMLMPYLIELETGLVLKCSNMIIFKFFRIYLDESFGGRIYFSFKLLTSENNFKFQ